MEISLNINSGMLESALKRFPNVLFTNVGLELKKSTRNIARESRTTHRFNSRTGTLERAVTTQYFPEKLTATVGMDKDRAPYGKYVHDGTKPHVIKPKKGKTLRFVGNGGFVFRKKVNHPGTKPDPFITKAGQKLQPRIKAGVSDAVRRSFNGVF